MSAMVAKLNEKSDMLQPLEIAFVPVAYCGFVSLNRE